MTYLNDLAEDIFEANAAKGFWDRERSLTETTMLIVTELAEAVEEERAGNAAVWHRDHEVLSDDPRVPEHAVVIGEAGLAYHEDDFERLDLGEGEMPPPLKPEGVDVELIDSLIRLLDLLGSRGTDVDGLLRQKLAYNASRPRRHGKRY